MPDRGVTDRWDSPLDAAERVCRLLSRGPRPLRLDAREVGVDVPGRWVTTGELLGMFSGLPSHTADLVWRSTAGHARAGDPRWRVVVAALATGRLEAISRTVSRRSGVMTGADAEAVVLATFLIAADRVDIDAAGALSRALAITRDEVLGGRPPRAPRGR